MWCWRIPTCWDSKPRIWVTKLLQLNPILYNLFSLDRYCFEGR